MGQALMSSCYPLNGEIACAQRAARWRPLVNWMLAISMYLWLVPLGYGAALVSLAGWYAIIFTGRLPERLGDYLVAVLRYQWRVTAFLCGLTTRYPRFPVIAGACLASPCHRSRCRREINCRPRSPQRPAGQPLAEGPSGPGWRQTPPRPVRGVA
jgi:Domain of unknown function (DUF4389)